MARIDIIKRLYSRNVTKLQFYYDRLIAPPISTIISPYVQDQLYQIARSNMKVDDKRYEQKQWMAQFGFKFMTSGTNRTVFRHLEDQKIIAKLALDQVGLRDSPKEYYNQRYLRPFCAKPFEVSPNAAIGLNERVNPITSIVEFLSIIDDAFDLLYNIMGKVVVQDVGTEYFMNWGLREGFGPCILDFPDIYELDGDKIYCGKHDMITGVVCDGQIDYDDGINQLYCTKCGKHFNSKDLAKLVETKEIIRKGSKTMAKVEIIVKGKSIIMDDGLDKSKTFEPRSVRNYHKAQQEVQVGNESTNDQFRTNMEIGKTAKDDITMQITVNSDVPEKRALKRTLDRQNKLKKDLAKVQKKQASARDMLHINRGYAPNGIIIPVQEPEEQPKKVKRVVIEINSNANQALIKSGVDADIPTEELMKQKYADSAQHESQVEPSANDGYYDCTEGYTDENKSTVDPNEDFTKYMNPPVEGNEENKPEVLGTGEVASVENSEMTDQKVQESVPVHQNKPLYSDDIYKQAADLANNYTYHIPTDEEIAAKLINESNGEWIPPVGLTNVYDELGKKKSKRHKKEDKKITRQEIEKTVKEIEEDSESDEPVVTAEVSDDNHEVVYEDSTEGEMSTLGQALMNSDFSNANNVSIKMPPVGRQVIKGKKGKKGKRNAKMPGKG